MTTIWNIGSSAADKSSFENLDIYPIRYVTKIESEAQDMLEAGCGTGRVFFHYKRQGKKSIGRINALGIYLNLYNRERPHPSLDGILPVQLYYNNPPSLPITA